MEKKSSESEEILFATVETCFLSHQPLVNRESFLTKWDGFLRQTARLVVEAVVDSQEAPFFRGGVVHE